MQDKQVIFYSAVVLPFVFAVSLISILAIKGDDIAELGYKILFADKDIASCSQSSIYCIDKRSRKLKIYKNNEHKTIDDCKLKLAIYDAVLDKIKYFNISYNQCKDIKPNVSFAVKGLENYRAVYNKERYNTVKSPDGYIFKQNNAYGQPSIVGKNFTIEKSSAKYVIDHRLLNIANDGQNIKYMKLQAWIK